MHDSQIDSIRADLEHVRHPLATSLSLPPRCYSDEHWLALETRRIFERAWVSVGREDRCPRAGDYAVLDLAGTPMMLLRDSSGRLRAWANTCRHRGSRLLSGAGNCAAVVCPLHAWTYGLDGALLSAARMECNDDFDPARFGLIEFQLACQDGFAFVRLERAQRDLADWLGDFSALHRNWSLDELRATRVREFEVACNWKLFLEVFNEYYHLPCVHPQSLAHAYFEPDECDAVIGEYTTQFGATDGTAALLSDHRDQALPPGARLRGRERAGTRYTWVYPNLTFAACFDSLWMYQAYPLGAARCNVIQTVAFPRASTMRADFAARAQAYYRRIDAALDEDLPFLREQQAGLSSRFARQGRFSALEPSVGNFACWYAQAMREE
ncbi:MAG: aromatic ring-hydroxylating oxygenase subunit alpha [bacterium]